MWYLILGFVAGMILTATPFIIWLRKARSGELQVYFQNDEIYPVLSVTSQQDFAKRYLLLKTVYPGSRD